MEEVRKHIIALVLEGYIVGKNGSVYKLARPGFQVLFKCRSETFDTVEEAVDFFLTEKKESYEEGK